MITRIEIDLKTIGQGQAALETPPRWLQRRTGNPPLVDPLNRPCFGFTDLLDSYARRRAELEAARIASRGWLRSLAEEYLR